jgi:high-affinity Fe2+/Pb2+ permease
VDRKQANSDLRLGAIVGVIAALAFGLTFYAAVIYIG